MEVRHNLNTSVKTSHQCEPDKTFVMCSDFFDVEKSKVHDSASPRSEKREALKHASG